MLTNVPFDDSLSYDRRRATSDERNTTSAIDPFRQGVELTMVKHFTQGIVKIHAGFNGQGGVHTIPQHTYGQSQSQLTNETYHNDVQPVEPVDYVTGDASLSNHVIDRGTDLDVGVSNFDGVIEAFHIRDIVALRREFASIERNVYSYLEEGNVHSRNSSDMFVSIVKSSEKNVGTFYMRDNVDRMGNAMMTVSDSVDDRRNGSFKDNHDSKGVVTSFTMDGDMCQALASMSPSSVNHEPDGYEQVGATGFDH